ncbi:hypothetical protein NQ176_g115 [Zarea fungicola]|uniref:Uncharacterized protein n=1 Tax=Zarea fungicola TaxID=93591 RepID=A0ACC1P0G7_9HYPO|nr:hypothetical protein NQ176_g115 [Lecanicillium fungicola]
MSDATSQLKTTPGRHRQRQNGRVAAQKAYASENDVASFEVGHYHQAPQTPSKGFSGLPAPGSQSSAQASSKQRNKNRGIKGKPLQVSPGTQLQDGSTPTGRRASMKSSIPAAAFAGATFHASPAPSALPMPSFHSKPSNETPGRNNYPVNDARYSPSTDNESAALYSSSAPRANESPLDFMFRAHRQEKERQFASPRFENDDSSFFRRRLDNSRQTSTPQTAPPSLRYNTGGIDRTELDGTPAFEIGPAFSTPYHERIQAARVSRSSAPSLPSTTQDHSTARSDSSTDDATAALKKFLFGGGKQGIKPPLASAAAAPPAAETSHQPAGLANSASYGRGDNIQAMENDLRRILKLDSPSS